MACAPARTGQASRPLAFRRPAFEHRQDLALQGDLGIARREFGAEPWGMVGLVTIEVARTRRFVAHAIAARRKAREGGRHEAPGREEVGNVALPHVALEFVAL